MLMIPAVVLLAAAAVTDCGGRDRRSEDEDWFADRAQETGLDFVHVNGMSGEFYIPKSCRPASRCSITTTTAISTCTSFRDRRSGPDDPGRATPPAPAQRTLLSQRPARRGRRHADAALHGRDAESGIDAARLRHGRRRRRHRQRRLGRPLPDELRHPTSCSATTVTARSRDVSEGERHRTHRALARVGGVSRLRPRRLARPVRRQLRATTASRPDRPASISPARATTVRRQIYRGQPDRLYRNRGDGTFADVTAAALVGARVRPGARRGHRRLQRRRVDRHLRRQRRRGEPALDQPARRHVREHGAARRRRADG